MVTAFESYLLDSHFVYGPNKQNSIVPCENNKKKCRHNINYSLDFSAASIDLNNDGIDEVLVQFENANQCGPTGPCYTDILYKDEDTWIFIGDGTNDLRGSNLYVSNKYKNGYQTIFIMENLDGVKKKINLSVININVSLKKLHMNVLYW